MVYTHLNTGYHGLLALPNITLTSVLACCVYRNMRLSLEQPSDILLPSPNVTATVALTFIAPAETGSAALDVVLSLGQSGGIPDKIPNKNIYR